MFQILPMDNSFNIFIISAIGVALTLIIIVFASKRFSNDHYISSLTKKRKDYEESFKAGIPANAEIINVLNSHQSLPRPIEVQLLLSVMPVSGEKYQTIVLWDVQPLSIPLLQPGQVVSVKIDSKDKKKVYPNVNWAEYAIR